jgi:hypothetical protein
MLNKLLEAAGILNKMPMVTGSFQKLLIMAHTPIQLFNLILNWKVTQSAIQLDALNISTKMLSQIIQLITQFQTLDKILTLNLQLATKESPVK